MMSRTPPVSPQEWSSLWERAAIATAGHPPHEMVYTGPPWEIPSSSAAVTSTIWKVAVLQRRPIGGAEHWGHLFLLVGERTSEVRIAPEGGVPGAGPRPPLEALPPSEGSQFEVRIRPRSGETTARLLAFARDFQRQVAALLEGRD